MLKAAATTGGAPWLRRWIPTASLIVAAVAGVAMGLADLPFEYPPGAHERLNEVRESPENAYAVGAFFLVWQVFLIPGILRAATLASGRGSFLALLGGGLIILGIFGHAVAGGAHLLQVDMAKGSDMAAMEDLYTRSQENPVYLPFTAIGLLGFLLGFILLAIGLLRSRAVRWWIPTAILVGLVTEFGLGFLPYGSFAGLLVFGAGLVGLALELLRLPNASAGRPSPASTA